MNCSTEPHILDSFCLQYKISTFNNMFGELNTYIAKVSNNLLRKLN